MKNSINLVNEKQETVNKSVARFLLLLAAVMFCVELQGQPAPRMGISPDRYLVSFDERGGDTQSMMIQNLSNEPMTVTLSVGTWDLDDNNQLRVIPPSERSLDQWIVINPIRVTIPAGSPQTVRWTIMPRLKPEHGEYRAILFLEEELADEEGLESGSLRMKMRYGLPIYGHVGERILGAQLNEINVDKDNNRVFLDITNTGNTHGRMSGFYGVWPLTKYPGSEEALSLLRRAASRNNSPSGFTYTSMPEAVILPENRRSIPLDVGLENPGDYIIQFDAEFAGLEITDTVEITIPGT